MLSLSLRFPLWFFVAFLLQSYLRLWADSTVVFNEIQYNPGDSQEGEWIEFHNQMGIRMDLSNWQIDGGVEYTFPAGTVMEPGSYLVVAKDPSNSKLASIGTVLGPYEGFLSNGGDRLDLMSSANRLMDRLDYGDDGKWPVAADGSGATLAKKSPGLISRRSSHWVPSLQVGGTPGSVNFSGSWTLNPYPLLLNEVTGAGDEDFFIEIENVSDSEVRTSGYLLVMDGVASASISLPETTIAPGQFLLLTEEQLGRRAANGDKLFLYGPGGEGVADGQEVTKRLRGRSSEFPGEWIFPDAPTPGSVNQFVFETEIIINEICYSAPILRSNPVHGIPRRKSDEEWIELYNRGDSTVDLSGWDFGEGINFDFPLGTSLESGGYLVIAKDPAAVLSAHPGIQVIGPFSGSLDGNGEHIKLRDAANNPVDQVRYSDGGEWPAAADGNGSTLELTDPDSDNSLPGAWAASDEMDRTIWRTYSYRGVASPSSVGPDNQWKEFILGLLEEGEVLLDDISVVENPSGAATQMISDGSFESGNLDTWRFLGNHRHAAIIPDPDDESNHVLHLRATGSTEHMHNHVETTFADGESVNNGTEYEISYRVRWLSGSDLLNTRLYFNRLPMTRELFRPTVFGTPGKPNSTLVDNAGPTSWGLSHAPVVPDAGEAVTVGVDVLDPDGVEALTLHYSVNGGYFQQVAMALVGSGSRWEGTIPGQAAGRTVRFYVESFDRLGATSHTPRKGPDSGAMYEVEDGRAATTGILNFRIVMDPADVTWMHTPINVMSNDRIPCTVIYNEEEVYYNCGVRIKGSQRARLNSRRVGFNVGFPKDHLFRGVHRTVAIDRSEGQNVGQRELLFDLMATSSGGIPGEFNDLCYVISPDPAHTSAAILQLSRFMNTFLDTQFDDGGDGTVYEYELIYYPTTADANGYKIPNPDQVTRVALTDLGDHPESYRWNYLIKNNQEFDDFSGILRVVKQFAKTGAAFEETVEDVLDVDQWLRSLAYSCATGAGDSYFANSKHNGQFYSRPDGRMLYFTHDTDFSFSTSRNIFENTELKKLTANPARKRAYLAHLHDICTSVYNQTWMAPWTTHFDALVPGGNVFSDDLNYIHSRSTYILGQVNSQVPSVPYAITTNGGANFSTPDNPVNLAGNAWLDVHEIRLADSTEPLDLTWTDLDSWSLWLSLPSGSHDLTLEAYDHQGNLIGTDTITVRSTATTSIPSSELLVISEIFFNPPGNDEDTEYVELLNISSSVILDLTGLSFTDGIEFTFPPGATLAPEARVLLVRDPTAFEAAFGQGHPIGGTYTGKFDNGGEALALTRADGTQVQAFTYNDKQPWPTAADGDGFSLVLLDPFSAPDHALPVNWRASVNSGGSPGTTDVQDYPTWKSVHGNPADDADPDKDGWTILEEYYLGGSPTTSDQLEPTYHFDFQNNLIFATVQRRASADAVKVTLQSSSDLTSWTSAEGAELFSNQRLSDSSPVVDKLTFIAPLSGPQFFRFVLSR